MANNTNLSFPSAFCQQFFKDGKPLSCGKLYTYIAGSSTSVVTYKTISGGTESANMNTNPIILDMSGKANLVISKDTAYKFVLFDRNDVKVDEWDNVTAGGSEGGGSSEEIVVEGTTNEINVSSNITQGVKHYVVSLSNTIKNAILSLLGLYENVVISLENKADKVHGATTGNLAALDAEGNLTDSGSKVSDFKTKQTQKSLNGSTTKTITKLSQDANGEIIPEFSDIDFDSKVLSFYPQSLVYMTPDERDTLNAKMDEVAYNGGFIILWGGRNANIPYVLSFYGTNEYWFFHIEKNVDKIDYYEEIVTYDPVTKTFNVDSSSTSINPSLYEKLANKKTTFSGFETSDTFYPTLKAVVDYLDSRLQNVGGKKITNNGVPFTAVSQLPTTTPYYGQNINTDDYAYVQDTGLASRYTAIVTGQSVAWSLDYEIAIPVFTAEQQAAIDSTINSTKVGNYDAHLNNTNNPHSVTAAQVGALTPNGNGSNVTASFTQAGSRNNIATGEKLSVIFGKIAKWFADLKAVAFSGSYSDLSDKPTIPSAANNGVLTITQNGVIKGTFSANQSSDTSIEIPDTNTWRPTQDNLTSNSSTDSLSAKQGKILNESKVSQLAFSHHNDSAGYHWFKLAVIPAQNAGSYSTVVLTGSCGSWGSSNKCEFTLHISVRDSIKFVTTQIEGKLPNIIRFELYQEADNSYSVYARIGSGKYVAFISYILCLGYSSPSDVSSFYDSVTGTLVANSDNSVLLVKIGNNGVGSSSLPIFAKADGTLSPINIDEYYCWAEPTPQWTDVMEMNVWYIQNQCNNEILGSVRRIQLNSSHPSLCYLRVNLPELIGDGRYRFTLEFEITNSSGQLGTEAYGVLILVPPTGYSGDPFLAECVYDSNGKAQSRVMNQIHIPPQGYTYRHKLYVDGHTYRVVKTM